MPERTLHVLSLPHTELTDKDLSCAYTQKVRRFCGMMLDQGCKVVLYGPDASDARCSEHVVVATVDDRIRWGFGTDGYDTALQPFLWDSGQPYWHETNTRTIDALRERVEPRDFLCLVTSTQDPVVQAVAGPKYNNPISVEWAVGYEGIRSPFCAFESHAWRHHVYGLQGWRNGRPFDATIPNFFDPGDFHLQRGKPGDYLLFIGRFIRRKGVEIAVEIARRSGRKLVVAGPGVTRHSEGMVESTHPGEEMHFEGDIDYVGQVGVKERAELMAGAYAVVVPTLYVEPFGGVAVESMLCGTPVIASDWGAFTETVTDETGFRFSTIREGVACVDQIVSLDRKHIRAVAIERFSVQSVGAMFTRWFDRLDTLWGDGYYQ